MTRERMIIEKAIDLFAKQGIDATSVQDITDACGISKGAFYLSFKSKEDLLLKIIEYFMKNIIAKNAEVIDLELPARERLFHYYLVNLKIFYEYSPFITIYMREHIRAINEEIVAKLNEYEKINDEAVLRLIDEILEERKEYRYDLLIMVKGFIFSHAGHILSHPRSYDLELLAHTLVDRTYILAEHDRRIFITQEMWERSKRTVHTKVPTIETVEELADQLMKRFKDNVLVTESIQLLLEEIRTESPRKAIIRGLLANLQGEPEMTWFTYCIEYLYRNHRRDPVT